MPSSLPDRLPDGVDDRSTLRWALRSDGRSGFVTIAWQQPHEPLDPYLGTRFAPDLGDCAAAITFPSTPIDIPPGTLAHWPVELDVAGVRLRWATASALARLPALAPDAAPDRPATAPDAVPTLVLSAEPGIPVELAVASHLRVIGDGLDAVSPGVVRLRDLDAPRLIEVVDDCDSALGVGQRLRMLVLPSSARPLTWVLDTARGTELLLSADDLTVSPDGRVQVRSFGRPPAPVTRFDPAAGRFVALELDTHPAPEAHATWELEPQPLRPARPDPATYGSVARRASAPTPDSIDRLTAIVALDLPADAPAASPGCRPRSRCASCPCTPTPRSGCLNHRDPH